MAVRTLIVDDSAGARNVIRRRLEQMGCEVVGEAGDAAEGLRLFHSMNPQLITLDLMMPEVEGVHAKGLFSMIREQAPEVAVIVISAQPKSTGERAEYLRRGALAYFEKPFLKLESLADRLAQLFPELNK